MGISPGMFGLHMVAAAYSPDGAAWLDGLLFSDAEALCHLLDEVGEPGLLP